MNSYVSVPTGTTRAVDVIVHNQGGASATGVVPLIQPGALGKCAWGPGADGGAPPGGSGGSYCTDTLGVGEACTLTLHFVPTANSFTCAITVNYDADGGTQSASAEVFGGM
jgi:hypothetical protein